MKSVCISFLQMLRMMKQDIMLLMMIFVPFLTGAVFKFLIPVAEKLLTDYFNRGAILSPYYEIFDLFLIIMTPIMLNFVVAIVILEETDDRMTSYLAVTPLGKIGYLFSRLGIMAAASFPVSIIVSLLFTLTQTNILLMVGIAFAGIIQAVIVTLMVVSLSANKVEGMAVGKMTTLFNIGVFAPYFISGNVQYIFAVLPTFWLSKAMQSGDYAALLISVALALLWILLLSKKFIRKVAG